ncbi:hypothetical protein [Oscillatoria acuminata]|uniref:hypothetical protein n=1 Tax=Oscillatoria acuminata TaxID=118323 RepID=UPI0002F8A5E9|nr:hypothetical protein [Oscillatoria acuminata]
MLVSRDKTDPLQRSHSVWSQASEVRILGMIHLKTCAIAGFEYRRPYPASVPEVNRILNSEV